MTRYTITCTGPAGAKTRLRRVLEITGVEQIRITETEQQSTDPVPRADNLPTSEAAKAVADLFGRAHDRPWPDKEIVAFRKAVKIGTITLENMTIITKYYQAERAKGDDGIHRRDLPTFLNNASGELDRAKAVKPSNGKALAWAPAANGVPMQSEEEFERIRLKTLEQIAAAKEARRK